MEDGIMINEMQDGEVVDRQGVMRTLMDVWTAVGAAQDNDEPVDCDWVQARLLAVGNFLQQHWEVDHLGNSTKYGAPVVLPEERGIDLFEEFLVGDDGTTKHERDALAKEQKRKAN